MRGNYKSEGEKKKPTGVSVTCLKNRREGKWYQSYRTKYIISWKYEVKNAKESSEISYRENERVQ